MIHILFFFHHFRRDTAVTNPHLFPFYRLSFAYQFQMNHHRNKKNNKVLHFESHSVFVRLHETKTIEIFYFSKYSFRLFFFPKHFDSILKFIMTKLLTFNRLFSALKMFCLFSTFLVVFFLSV